MKNLKLWSSALAIAFLVASCGTTAHVEKADDADFSRYKSFAWLDKDGEGSRDKNRSNDLTEERSGWR